MGKINLAALEEGHQFTTRTEFFKEHGAGASCFDQDSFLLFENGETVRHNSFIHQADFGLLLCLARSRNWVRFDRGPCRSRS